MKTSSAGSWGMTRDVRLGGTSWDTGVVYEMGSVVYVYIQAAERFWLGR